MKRIKGEKLHLNLLWNQKKFCRWNRRNQGRAPRGAKRADANCKWSSARKQNSENKVPRAAASSRRGRGGSPNYRGRDAPDGIQVQEGAKDTQKKLGNIAENRQIKSTVLITTVDNHHVQILQLENRLKTPFVEKYQRRNSRWNGSVIHEIQKIDIFE